MTNQQEPLKQQPTTEMIPFSEWIKGRHVTDDAGDGYEELSELSKKCIDAAIRRYIAASPHREEPFKSVTDAHWNPVAMLIDAARKVDKRDPQYAALSIACNTVERCHQIATAASDSPHREELAVKDGATWYSQEYVNSLHNDLEKAREQINRLEGYREEVAQTAEAGALQKVREWHEAFGVPVREVPDPFDDSDENMALLRLRARIMEEEVKEWKEAAIYNADAPERAKELADILYTVYGTILTEGLQGIIWQVFDAVHQSNMSKLGADGKPVKRADGKVLKGPNYQEPDLSFVKQWLEESAASPKTDQ